MHLKQYYRMSMQQDNFNLLLWSNSLAARE